MPKRTKPAPPDPASLLLTVQDVARLLRCSVATVWRMRANHAIPQPVTIGAHLVRWSRRALEDWLARGAPPCPALKRTKPRARK